MELTDLAQALRRFWLLAAAVVALVVGAGAAAAYVPNAKYTATATVLVQPKGTAIDFSSIDAVNFLLPSIATQVETRAFERRVLARLPSWIAAQQPSLGARLEPGTAIVHITGTTLQPAASAALANAAAKEEAVHPVTPARIEVSLLAPANAPTSPSSPRRVAILGGSLVLGLILALFSAVGANSVRRRIRTSDQIEKRLGVEVLAEVPAERCFASTMRATLEEHVEVAEAFQRLGNNVRLGLGNDLVLSVTSTVPGEGKSTVTAGLAWTLASIGHDVVAIDCDLRRPTLHAILGAGLGGGVAGVAEGADVDTVLQPTDQPTLSVISAGTIDRHPAQVLHAALPTILEELEGRVLVIDTPPMLGVSEATFVASQTHAVLFVLDGTKRKPAEVERVLSELRRSRVQILGAVVNRTRSRQASYAAKYYNTNQRAQWPMRSRRRTRVRS